MVDSPAVHVWHLATGTVRVLHGHTGRVMCVSNSPSIVSMLGGYLLASGSVDETIRIWNTHRNRCVRWLHTPSAVVRIEFSSDSSKLLSVGSLNVVCVWNVKRGDLVQKFDMGDVFVTSVCAFSRNSRQVILLDGKSKSTLVWDVANKTIKTLVTTTAAAAQQTRIPKDYAVCGARHAIAPNRKYMASHAGREICIWQVDTGAPVMTIDADAHVQHLTWSHSGTRLAWAGLEGIVIMATLVDSRWFCAMALALLQRDVAPYVVLDILDFLMTVTNTAISASFAATSTLYHYMKYVWLTQLQSALTAKREI
jgi:WD40 repeat protein